MKLKSTQLFNKYEHQLKNSDNKKKKSNLTENKMYMIIYKMQ